MSKNKSEVKKELLATLYKEAGVNYRYFLSWRHKLMVRFFVFLAAIFVVFRWLYESNVSLKSIWLVPFFGFFVTLALWCLDHRSKTLFRACQKTGEELEKEFSAGKISGVYKKINRTTEDSILIASRVMGIAYFVCSMVFLLSTIYLLVK
jgi:hypothetical protein